MNLRDPKVQKILLGALVLVASGYMYFGTRVFPFCYQVRREHVKALEQEYGKLSADLEKARQTVGKLGQLEAEYERLHDQWLSAQELLPEKKEMPELLRKVTTAGNQSGVEFMLFQPGAPVLMEDYEAHPVKVTVRGTYHQVGIFFSRLANMSRIVNVSELDMKSALKSAPGKNTKQNKGEQNYTVIANFTLTAHTLIGGEVNEDAAPAAAVEQAQASN